MEQSQQSSSSLVLPIRRGLASHQTIQDAKPVLFRKKSSKNDDDDDKIDGGDNHSDHEVIVVPLGGAGIGGGLKSDNKKNNKVDVVVEPCGVCYQNQARYTCPKCNVPYCSVKCYKSHNNNNANNTTTTTTTTSSSDVDNGTTTTTTEIISSECCTERFYRDRVTQVLQLETKGRKDETLRILNRTYHQQAAEDSLVAAEELNNHNTTTTIPQDELIKLLRILEGGDEEEISKILIEEPRLQLALNQAIETGELHDWLLDPWHPWWRPELLLCEEEESYSTGDGVEGGEEEGEALDVEEEQQEGGTTSRLKTIDERLLQIPSFSKLRPKNKNNKTSSSSSPPLPQLEYNLIDMLYSIVTTLRLYHGIQNATQYQDNETSISCANTLIRTSKVLSCDARFECLEEVMMSCITTTTTTTVTDDVATSSSLNNAFGSIGNNNSNTPWDVLATDVALICQNPRTVARALFEAIDILNNVAAAKKKKKNAELIVSSAADNNNNNNNNQEEEEEGASHHQMRRIRKKVEYYLSWSKERPNPLSTISLDLKEWIAHWKK